MNALFLIGRVLFDGFFVFSSYGHFAQADHMAAYAASKGILWPKLSVVASGLLVLVGGASILLGAQPAIGVACIVLFLIPC